VEIFGHLERLVDDLYPYRWVIAAATLAVLGLLGVVGYARGWHRAIWRRRWLSAAIALPVLLVSIPVGYYTLSPLWTRTTLYEESPLVALAMQRQEAGTSSTLATTATPSAVPDVATVPVIPRSTPTEPTMPTPARTTTAAQPDTATPLPAQEPQAPTPAVTPAPPAPTPEPPTPMPFVPHIIRSGQFSGADDFHFGSGTALLIETAPGAFTLRFEEFSVRNGPDLHVYLSTARDGLGDGSLDLGSLKATDGSFNYEVPPGVDVSAYGSVLVWCEPFAVLFAIAPLV
jgi:hypothetical protein